MSDTAIPTAATPSPSHPSDHGATAHPDAALLAHHFENLEQQRSVGTLGMWVFLASEVLFFGGVFTAYSMMRQTMPSGFAQGSQRLDAVWGGINTAVLLTSSLTMALAVWAAQSKDRKLLQLFLGLTLFFGTVFLVIKGFEWYTEYEHHLLPGPYFGRDAEGNWAITDPRTKVVLPEQQIRAMQMFFVFYFTITGLHALHMLVGLAVLVVLLALSVRRPAFGIADYNPIEVSGLYWHFVDVVWIFVFPILYLLRS